MSIKAQKNIDNVVAIIYIYQLNHECQKANKKNLNLFETEFFYIYVDSEKKLWRILD